MNDSDLFSAVDSYFAAHLDAAFWNARTEAEKTAAVTMAKNQVLAELGLSALPDHVAEGFPHSFDAMKEGKVGTGESVGDLSVSYSLLAGSGISTFARMFIDTAKRAVAPALVRIGRG